MAAKKKKGARRGRDGKGRFLKGWYQPCTPKARIKKAKVKKAKRKKAKAKRRR
jgi:hypothetical protein